MKLLRMCLDNMSKIIHIMKENFNLKDLILNYSPYFFYIIAYSMKDTNLKICFSMNLIYNFPHQIILHLKNLK